MKLSFIENTIHFDSKFFLNAKYSKDRKDFAKVFQSFLCETFAIPGVLSG